MSYAAAVEPLRAANLLSGRELYRWSALTIDGLPVNSSDGLQISPDNSVAAVADLDILFVCGGYYIDKLCSKALLDSLRELARQKLPLGGLCTGSYVLAAAGLLLLLFVHQLGASLELMKMH